MKDKEMEDTAQSHAETHTLTQTKRTQFCTLKSATLYTTQHTHTHTYKKIIYFKIFTDTHTTNTIAKISVESNFKIA